VSAEFGFRERGVASASDELKATEELQPLSETAPEQPDPRPEDLATLRRIEHVLDEMRNLLDTTQREQQHRVFSPARLAGAILQALVVGLVAWALSDWILAAPAGPLQIKLAFAAVLQLIVLTAFASARQD
jgi:hypothetical protein